MAPIKRKANIAIESHPPEKKQKQKPSSAAKLSVLKEEEPAFPRGGASILTPLEHKQIQIQAKQDALFEQETGRKIPIHEFQHADYEEGLPDHSNTRIATTEHKSKPKDRREGKHKSVRDVGVRIEGLSYKRLIPGSIVLGQVSQINRYDIALSLPDNLTGYIPLTSVSDKLTQRMEALAAAEEEDIEGEGDNHGIYPRALFSIGQYLRAYVISTQPKEASGANGKRHIELSVNPREANSGLAKTDIVTNSVIQASVISVEDHGLVMDLGLGEPDVRGFLSSKELGADVDTSQIEAGSVYLCLVSGKNSDGNIIKLSADPQKIGNIKKGNYVADAPTVDAFLPGTAVDILVSEVTATGIAGKVMGLLDVTADFTHSGAASSGKDLEKKYSVGSKVKGRIICTFPNTVEKKLGASLLDHIVYFRSKTTRSLSSNTNDTLPTKLLPISKILDEATVVKVEPGVGLLVDVGVKGVRGFVHISKVSDGKVETLAEATGRYKVGSVHKARVIGYNGMDGLFIISLESKIIDQPFLRMEDVNVGQVVKGTVERLMIGSTGVKGLIIKIAEGVTGLVPETHLADFHLQNPERKFKEGNTVTARVLSTHPDKRQIRLTLKKTLVNSDAEPWIMYENLRPGLQAPGTLVNILPSGAVVQFYGCVRGFLPVSEMSESYIQDPKDHFLVGQVVNVHIVSIDEAEQRMIVSCKDPLGSGAIQQEVLDNINIGEGVIGKVIEKSNDEIFFQLENLGIKATLPIEHLADGSSQKCLSLAKRIRVGQVLKGLIILTKQETKRSIRLTSKPSLIKAANEGKLLKVFEDVTEGAEVHGFVRNITLTSVFVQFAGGLTGLLPRQHISDEAISLPDFGMRRDQSVSTKVLSVDHGQRRFLLTMKPLPREKDGGVETTQEAGSYGKGFSNPVDQTSTSIDNFTFGKLTKAKIVSIKDTQINVQLADEVQGRIDVSEVFDRWEEISNQKHPLGEFHVKQVLPVRVLGMHDSRNHRFLPITHRGKAQVFELTAKPSYQNSTDLHVLTIDKVEVDSVWLAFVNNISHDCLWVNLSPNVRGRIRAMDVSADVSQLQDLAKHFPVGSVLQAKVVKVDVENNRLDLSARSGCSTSPITIADLSKGMILPGRVTRVTDRQVMVQLSDSLSAPINLVDLADNYDEADPTVHQKNQILHVWVKDVDVPNKRITLSARPSRVLSSSLPVEDEDITSVSQIKVNDVRRGFIKNVVDIGIFVSLASNVTAFVRVSDLSDDFLKEWKSGFAIDQLVKGKIIAVDPDLNHVRMSLKRSHLEGDYKPLLEFTDMKVGQTVTGKVRKVADFGLFVVVDKSANVSGLCHRTKMSDQPGADPKKLYEEGDVVQARVLRINKEKKQISLGLKASYFSSGSQRQIDTDFIETDQRVGRIEEGEEFGDGDELTGEADVVRLDEDFDLGEASNSAGRLAFNERARLNSDVGIDGIDEGRVDTLRGEGEDVAPMNGLRGVSPGGVDWTGEMLNADNLDFQSDADADAPRSKKKRKKAEIQIDKTGDLDTNGPQSGADFERLLLGQPNNSVLWLSYMAFQLQLSEVGKAREVAERALKTINMREEIEKLNVWIALLNLENTYGSDESLEKIFERACDYNDRQEIHERLISIYIQSGKPSKADDLFQATLKKHSQSPDLYINYATFLMTTLSAPDRARALLPRAMQALPQHTHLGLTSKFAQLEFNSPNGEPERGRTIFETLLSQWPKRLDLWNVLLDLEMKQGDQTVIRHLFERVTGSGTHLKTRKAKFFFKKWLEYEEKLGDSKSQEKVKARAGEYVRSQGQQEAEH